MARLTLTTEQFITRAKTVHGDLYDYKLVEYKGAYTKIKIICKEHGEFEQNPNDHLKGSGCKNCSNEARASTAKSEFNNKANIIHNSKYDYSLVEYRGAHSKVTITCKSHGEFLQSPANHLQGKGCPHCALTERGWTRTKFKDKCIKNNDSQGILYVLECFNDTERFIKIGITSLSIKKRYASTRDMPYEYTTLHELVADPEVIYDLETLLHKKSCNYRYTPSIPFGGYATECFLADTTYIDKLNTYINKLNNIQIRSNNAE